MAFFSSNLFDKVDKVEYNDGMKLIVTIHASGFVSLEWAYTVSTRSYWYFPYFHRFSDKMISKWINLKAELYNPTWLVLQIIYRFFCCCFVFLFLI